jgi:3-oxoacyl-[acyl-carrier-protein] synthase-1
MTPMAIKASGMVTAVGFNSRATCAAIRAGVSGVQKDNIWDPIAGEYISVGRPRTPQWWEGADMLAELAAPAITECLGALPQGTSQESVPIFVLLSPPDRPCREPELGKVVLDGLHHRLRSTGRITVYGLGRTGILPALREADKLFSQRTATHAIVVGVDTFLRQSVAEAYMEQRRVLTASNSNGFIPGEAACAVLLAPPSDKGDPELRIIACGEGRETGTITSENPLTGNGITQALREALRDARIKMADAHYWLTDQNAEHYKAKECTLAQIRLERRDKPAVVPFQIWHPIEFLGEIGSAIGPCLLGVGLSAAKGQHAPGPVALMSVSEDNGERAAFVLRWHSRN